jgi:hypothetical protein
MLMQANVASHKTAAVCTIKPTDQSTAGPERQTEFYPVNRPRIENARAVTLFKLSNCEPRSFLNCDKYDAQRGLARPSRRAPVTV